jgi:dUTP pyrophosphatase
MEIKIELLDKECNPERMSEHAVGFDIKSSENALVPPRSWHITKTGFKLELPPGYEAQIRPRSGLAAKHGITVLNTPGTIDPDYRGEIAVILFNTTNTTFTIKQYDRIAQMIINKVEIPDILYGKVSDTKRGEEGFGSTGIK